MGRVLINKHESIRRAKNKIGAGKLPQILMTVKVYMPRGRLCFICRDVWPAGISHTVKQIRIDRPLEILTRKKTIRHSSTGRAAFWFPIA